MGATVEPSQDSDQQKGSTMSLSTTAIELRRRAQILARTLGMKTAAGFLRNRRVDFAEAVFILTGRMERFPHLASRGAA
jgi:hypothetical protein